MYIVDHWRGVAKGSFPEKKRTELRREGKGRSCQENKSRKVTNRRSASGDTNTRDGKSDETARRTQRRVDRSVSLN